MESSLAVFQLARSSQSWNSLWLRAAKSMILPPRDELQPRYQQSASQERPPFEFFRAVCATDGYGSLLHHNRNNHFSKPNPRFYRRRTNEVVMSEYLGSLRDVFVALFAWIAIAAPIVAAGISPVLAALAASVVVFDVAYYNRLSERDPVASCG